MMEENGASLTPGAAEDGSEVLMSGEVYCRDTAYQLLLTQSGLRLIRAHVPETTKTTTTKGEVLEVKWAHVLCACDAPMKKSKSTQSQLDTGSSSSNQNCAFVIHYSIRNQKTNKVQCKNISLESRTGNAGQWIARIEEKCKQGKPRKLLIVINPIGGKGTARQTFEKRAQPLFTLAGIELVVKVTERAKHAVEIVKTFDISSVDGIIAVGGDGMYMEILHSLTLRKQEEEGVDFNDPDATLSPPSVSVGIIPAGTGNGVSDWLNGVIDFDTATLNIIRGDTRRVNIFSVHECGKLIHYAGLLLGNGYFSNLIQRTDELRWMRRARYPYAMVSCLFKKKQILDFDVEVLRNHPEQETDTGKAEGAEAMPAGWSRLGTKHMVATMAFIAKIQEGQSKLQLNPFYPGFDLIIIDKSSALDNLKFLMSIFTRNKQALERDYIEWISDIQGARFKFVQKIDGDTDRRQQDQALECSKLLDVDGEIMHLSSPEFDVRLRPQFLPVFCVPELYNPVSE